VRLAAIFSGRLVSQRPKGWGSVTRQSRRSRSALCRCPPIPLRDAVHRPQLAHDPRPAREGLHITLQSSWLPCLPLFAIFKTGKELPLVFHQSLVAFCQKYKDDLTQEQREALLDVNNGSKGHHAMAPEIKKELLAGKSRVDPDQKMDIK
jgi:Bystin